MAQFNTHEAKTHLSQLLDRAVEGEEIVIARNGKPVAKLTAVKNHKPRRLGLMKGKIWMADDFNETPQEIIDSFYDSKIFPNALH